MSNPLFFDIGNLGLCVLKKSQFATVAESKTRLLRTVEPPGLDPPGLDPLGLDPMEPPSLH